MICPRCATNIEPRKRKCGACGKKVVRRRPKHLAALELSREHFVEANDGYDGCWICRHLGIEMKGRLQRDHWHTGPLKGQPRGVLCPFHNRRLGSVYTPELVAAMHAYLGRAA